MAPPGAESPWVRLRTTRQHPFIFEKMIDAADPTAKPGDIVNIYDKDGALCGRGLFNPRSQIVVRVLSRGDVAIDDAFWRERLRAAVELRRALRIEESTDAYRLVHAEGDGLSGLVIERYAGVLAFELFSLGIVQRFELLARILAEALGPPARLERPGAAPSAWRVVYRVDERSASIEGVPERRRSGVAGETDAERLSDVTVRENGVRFRIDVMRGHKTGFFCDQRENRRRLAPLCRDAQVLDLCCYTGGFALAAKVLGGAREVTAVDLDEGALALARQNANLNQARVQFVHADAFGYMRQMLENGREYDVVVLDPPKLAPTRADLEEALRKYHDLNRLAARLVRRNGWMLSCSCSGLVTPPAFAEVLQRAARSAGRRLQLFDQTGAGPDHPVALDCPESAYLKAFWMRVE